MIRIMEYSAASENEIFARSSSSADVSAPVAAIIKDVRDVIEITSKEHVKKNSEGKKLSRKEKDEMIKTLTAQMKEADKLLEFEHAAFLRDKIKELSE